jgi:signal transduction histidine kinase
MWKKLLTIYAVFAISLAVLVGLSLFSFQRYNAYVNYTDAVDHQYTMLTALYELKALLMEAENKQRGLLLYEDSTFYDQYASSVQDIKQCFGRVHTLASQDRDQQKRLYKLNMAIKSHLDFLNTGMTVGIDSLSRDVGKKIADKCFSLIGEMDHAEQRSLAGRQTVKEFYESKTPQYFRVVFIFTLLIFCISFGLLVGQYRSRVKYQQSLEQKIIELNQANAEWEQMSYVASHDLQEPLRKIRTFSDRLLGRHLSQLDDDGQAIVKRIDVASTRAQSLMQDIVNYNTIVYSKEDLTGIVLHDLITEIARDPDHAVTQKNATIQCEQLPTLQGYPSQVSLLFRALLDNSVKFSKPDQPCLITIKSETLDKNKLPGKERISYSRYYKITIADNGIGFEDKFSEKIFQMFQRLHPQESSYTGRGLGLALVKRIMTNHHGLVEAHGELGRGAIFTLYFPVH